MIAVHDATLCGFGNSAIGQNKFVAAGKSWLSHCIAMTGLKITRFTG